MSDPIPGWYPDPEEPSRQRFWDGTRWTEARAYPVAAGLVADAPQDESKGTNWGLVVGLVALLGVVLLAVWFFLLRGSSGEPTPVPVPSLTPTAVPTAPTKKPTLPPITPTAPPTAPTAPPTAPTGVPTP